VPSSRCAPPSPVEGRGCGGGEGAEQAEAEPEPEEQSSALLWILRRFWADRSPVLRSYVREGGIKIRSRVSSVGCLETHGRVQTEFGQSSAARGGPRSWILVTGVDRWVGF